jgi:superfamily I DNA/RNA helicase
MLPDASVEDWRAIVEHHDIEFATVTDEETGIQYAREILAASNAELDVIDFDDMLYLCWLKNAPISRYDYVMIDEAQDTNTCQRELLHRMLGKNGRLVAVGDSFQAIYGFRGADSGAMDAIAEEFNCARLPLSISYRCPRSVITAANTALGLGEEVIEPREDAPEGTVKDAGLFAYSQFNSEDLIVCRNTAPVVGLAYKLIAARVPVKVLGRDIGRGLINIIKKMRAHGIDALEEKIDAWERREVEAAMSKRGAEMRAQSISDKAESIRASIDALDENHRTIPALIANIEALFSDNGPRVCTLSTVHKAKGLEARRVFVLDPQLMPSKYAKQDWQKSQERNLIYVAYTRALDTLMFVDTASLREANAKNGG